MAVGVLGVVHDNGAPVDLAQFQKAVGQRRGVHLARCHHLKANGHLLDFLFGEVALANALDFQELVHHVLGHGI